MLKLQHLTKRFGTAPLFTDLCMEVDAPVVLWAPSGWGKTTLLRILMGLERPTAGSVEGVGRVAAVFQEDRLCPQLTAPGNIALTGADAAAAVRELEALGFSPEDLHRPAAALSGGQRRRAALLRALLCRNADTLLLDEPFTGMDETLVEQAAAATVRLTAGRDALLVTHDPRAAALLGWPVLHL